MTEQNSAFTPGSHLFLDGFSHWDDAANAKGLYLMGPQSSMGHPNGLNVPSAHLPIKGLKGFPHYPSSVSQTSEASAPPANSYSANDEPSLQSELQRLEILKEDFLSTVSHELKTPLSSMYLSIQLLEVLLSESTPSLHLEDSAQKEQDPMDREQSQPQSERSEALDLNTSVQDTNRPLIVDRDKQARIRRCLDTLSQECKKEITFVNNLLMLQESLSTLPHPALACIFLRDWLKDIFMPFQMELKRRHHQFHWHIPADLSYIISDHVRLEKIIHELMTNACKFTPDGGMISFSVAQHKDHLGLTVLSKGEAIPHREIPRLFDMFHRVPKGDPWRTSGTGIGLTLVKKLTETLGGTVQVTTGNSGNAFTIQLPHTKV